MLSNEEVIQELLNLAKQIKLAKEAGNQLGLTDEEMAFYDALTKGKADAVLAASLFHYKELEICELKDYLADKGISVRR